MKYLSEREVLIIHSEIIDRTGGLHGIRDTGLLISIIEKPKMKFGGRELYKGTFIKASVYLESFAKYHVFIDGNKRIAIAAAGRFLFLNNYKLTATNEEVEKFVVDVIVKKLEIKEIAEWLKKNSKKVS